LTPHCNFTGSTKYVKGTTITTVNELKCLGLTFDSSLNWTSHICDITKRCNSVLYSLYPLQPFLSEVNRKVIVNAFIIPIIQYMCPVWGTAPKYNTVCIENLLRKLGRFVLGLNKYDPVKSDVTNKLKWLFPEFLYKSEMLKLVFNIIQGNCPDSFVNYLDFADTSTIVTRTNTYVKPMYEGFSELYKRN